MIWDDVLTTFSSHAPHHRDQSWSWLWIFLIGLFLLFLFFPTREWRPVELSIQGQQTRTWIAHSNQQHQQGLQKHERLASNEAMLFVFDQPKTLRFWMPPSMKFPIDLVFLDQNFQVNALYANIKPCRSQRLETCERYLSKHDSLYALELPAGKAQELGLSVGTRASILGPPLKE